jgi:myo-inositol-1(or 4)-monophosphatase
MVAPNLMKVAESAAREAAEIVRERFGSALQIETKQDKSLVTDIDKQLEALIVNKIKAAFPSHRIIGEEGGSGASSGEYLWVIDPLDGTHNFIRGIKDFGVSIGVCRGDEFVAGVIALPLDNAIYRAEKGCGCYRNDTRLQVSTNNTLAHCSLILDSSLIRIPPALLQSLLPEIFNIRIYGCSVRNFTYLAEGRMDSCIEYREMFWDYAAGICLLQEAGGMVTNHDGSPFVPGQHTYLASNGLLHGQLLDHIRRHG